MCVCVNFSIGIHQFSKLAPYSKSLYEGLNRWQNSSTNTSCFYLARIKTPTIVTSLEFRCRKGTKILDHKR